MTHARIVAVGARSPLGLDARQLLLAYRAHKLAPRRCVFGAEGAPRFGTARAIAVGDDVVGFERLVELARPPFDECLATLPDALASQLPAQVVVHLAVPDARPEVDVRVGAALLERVAGTRADLRGSTLVAGGHAGFAVALERAIATSRSTGQLAVAGAVDTYHDEPTLRWLADDHRLHGPGTTDGFIPSEAAAFVLVSADPRGPRLAGVSVVETGADESDESSDRPEVAVVMTEVVTRALDRAPGPVDWVLTDVDGERHRAKEWSFVQVRLRERLDPAVVVIEQPYEELGEVGAASGALFTSLVCMSWEVRASAAKRALVALRAEGAPRAAIVLEAP